MDTRVYIFCDTRGKKMNGEYAVYLLFKNSRGRFMTSPVLSGNSPTSSIARYASFSNSGTPAPSILPASERRRFFISSSGISLSSAIDRSSFLKSSIGFMFSLRLVFCCYCVKRMQHTFGAKLLILFEKSKYALP